MAELELAPLVKTITVRRTPADWGTVLAWEPPAASP